KQFVFNEVLLVNKIDLFNEWLSQLSLEEFNALCKTYIPNTPDDIGAIAPIDKLFTEKRIRNWINESLLARTVPYVLPETPEQLIGNVKLATLKKGKFTLHTTGIPGTQEFKLNNGLKVILDTT